MRRIRDRVAGLDVHKDTVVACTRVFDGSEVSIDKERFASTRAGITQLAKWLAEREVTTVGMEATGVYWKPVYYGLEGLFEELWLCNAQHVKNVPGRKTDMADAEWLADVVAHGMVRPSLVPDEPIREVRELTRYRKTQIATRGQEIQRLDKLLQDASIKLSSVASKVLTQSGRDMVEALIAGERAPAAHGSCQWPLVRIHDARRRQAWLPPYPGRAAAASTREGRYEWPSPTRPRPRPTRVNGSSCPRFAPNFAPRWKWRTTTHGAPGERKRVVGQGLEHHRHRRGGDRRSSVRHPHHPHGTLAARGAAPVAPVEPV